MEGTGTFSKTAKIIIGVLACLSFGLLIVVIVQATTKGEGTIVDDTDINGSGPKTNGYGKRYNLTNCEHQKKLFYAFLKKIL